MTEGMWLAQVLKKTAELRELLENSPRPVVLFTWEEATSLELCARNPDPFRPPLLLAELELGTMVLMD